jgi:hypothetical protein
MGATGWLWGSGQSQRWGTNVVGDDDQLVVFNSTYTQSFWTYFDSGLPTLHEAQGAASDSGGPVWIEDGGVWKLAGVISVTLIFENQPASTALHGNATSIVDLASYRDAILEIVQTPDCSNGLDDDGDGTIDAGADPGCSDALDTSERDPTHVCDDGIDNDGDQLVDWPIDPDCADLLDYSEAPVCFDGFDNDGDGLTDSPADPGCFAPGAQLENPACDDGLDNDNDGGTDWDGSPPDSECIGTPWRDREWSGRKTSCGLGWELALVLPLLCRVRPRGEPRSRADRISP